MLLLENVVHLEAAADLLIDDGRVVTMTPAGHCEYSPDFPRFDGGGLTLLPALIDCHTHLREPGFEYKEDISTGLSAAAHGGFGAIMCMANTRPVNDAAAITVFMLERARKSWPHGPDLYPIAAATKELAGVSLAPLAELKEAGCVAVSNDGRPLESAEILRRVMEYAADLGMIFIDHCEDPWLAKNWRMNEGRVSGELGVKGQPWCGEAIQAARDIMIAEYLDLPAHIAHVSSAATVDIIAWGKARGVKITAETCPHYLLLDETWLEGYNTQAKVSPPLRGPEDREALRKAVREGVIDILATDHAPHAAYEKDVSLDDAPCGFSGLDLALPLTFRLVDECAISEKDLHRLWAVKPGEIFGIPVNDFSPGDPADFILYDPGKEWIAAKENFYSKSWNTPFLGQTIRGRVVHHWHRGYQLF
ncbi:MAG: dihydroorotase [Desulfovibrio sp.]|nr:dihydroorotase [Desulfovibrio sp.]